MPHEKSAKDELPALESSFGLLWMLGDACHLLARLGFRRRVSLTLT
ncbi:MAG: hypothetical protein VX453_01055 [Acidobacteriota bacterium]|nr:hypothetical protein [Acidobacteriota bacterium]